MDVARRLLASSNPDHQIQRYDHVYKLNSSDHGTNYYGQEYWNVTWNTAQAYDYSDGYFEITSEDDAETGLQDIWEELATIINNQTNGSTGAGWIVKDTMDNYVDFSRFEGAEINGHTLSVSEDGKKLITTIDEEEITVAQIKNDTITWTLNDTLAEKSIRYKQGIDYTYRLTYWIELGDSQKTEFRNTNETTYVEKNDKPGTKLYPEKMPFYINVIGNKQDKDTQSMLSGAEFAVYKDEGCTELLQDKILSDENGHFAFQIGQTDMTKAENSESYTVTVYLKEIKAPEDYKQDTAVHPITIAVNNVNYDQYGYGSGRVTVSYTPQENDLVGWDNEQVLITYNNEKNFIDFPVEKRWSDNDNKYDVRPDSVTFKLQYQTSAGSWENVKDTANENRTIELNSGNNWKGTFADLDPNYEYRAIEVEMDSHYTASNDGITNEDGSITNTLNWKIIKCSSTNQNILLEGAKFELSISDKGVRTVYTGESDAHGVIRWQNKNGNEIKLSELPDGTYTLEETEAPQGYSCNKEKWTIDIKDGVPKSVTYNNKTIEHKMLNDGIGFYFEDDANYALPSAGGPGIFLYMIGGTLLLMAGSLMIYINRRRGVLKK